jgi:flavin-dependent dehydrogenase
MPHDVIIVGAGPAGALAATILARAGVRVRVFDRATFPRHKLCGDTLNPGALATLAPVIPIAPLVASGWPLAGMRVTGPGAVAIEGRYAEGLRGRSVPRRTLDAYLVQQAATAGAAIEEGVTVSAPRLATQTVDGIVTKGSGGDCAHAARIVIAADGRESRLARALGLSGNATRPRRWAVGAYFEDVAGLSELGEMHIRRGHYIGVAPMPGGLANACLVVPHGIESRGLRDPGRALTAALAGDPELAPRFARARVIGAPTMLGPMAVDSDRAGVPGLLLAGDAAGFIDPMTGDGLRLALQGAVFAAQVALAVLNGTCTLADAAAALTARRRAAFGAKWRFNRVLRALVASPTGVVAATAAARVLPGIFHELIRYAGDCGIGQTRSDAVTQSKVSKFLGS